MGKTMRGADGDDQWDLGGQWIGTCQLEIMELLGDLDLTLYGQYNTGKRLLQVCVLPMCISVIHPIIN